MSNEVIYQSCQTSKTVQYSLIMIRSISKIHLCLADNESHIDLLHRQPSPRTNNHQSISDGFWMVNLQF